MDDTQSLRAALESADADGASLNALLAAWGKPGEGAVPAPDDSAALDRFFRRNGWSYDRLKPALDQLIALDLPALVKVVADGKARWISLVHAEDDRLTVVAGSDGPLVVDRAALESVYGAEAIVPWHDPAPGTPAMREGQAGEAEEEHQGRGGAEGAGGPGRVADAAGGGDPDAPRGTARGPVVRGDCDDASPGRDRDGGGRG